MQSTLSAVGPLRTMRVPQKKFHPNSAILRPYFSSSNKPTFADAFVHSDIQAVRRQSFQRPSMSPVNAGFAMESQPDHNPHIQGFREWCESPNTFHIGCYGYDNDEKPIYISLRKLKKYLNRSRVGNLLSAVFDNGDKPAPDVDRLISHYLRPFAILLYIGEGNMICHFMDYRHLKCSQLPFQSKPSGFPSSSRRDLFAAFRQVQWTFCAVNLEYSNTPALGSDDILPINSKDIIDSGGSSVIYKITVDPDYDRLMPQNHAVGPRPSVRRSVTDYL